MSTPYATPPSPSGEYSVGRHPIDQHPSGRNPTDQYPPVGPGGGRASGRAVALRVLGIGLVLVLLLAAAGSLVAQFFQQQRTETTTVTEAVSRLVLRNDVGDVRIRGAAAGTPAQVTRILYWSFREPTVDVTTANGLLSVTGDCAGMLSGWCSADLDITLPAGTTLELQTGFGDIRSSDTTGTIEAESGTGDVILTAPGAATVRADTGVGDVTITGGAPGGRIQAQTGTGDVRFVLSSAPGEVRIETGTGDVVVSVPAGHSYHVDSDTGVGEIRIGVPQDDTSVRRMTLESGTGDITVRAG